MRLTAIHIYPVKSLRGCRVSECALDPLGLVGDRRFMVVDEQGRFVTQRAQWRMALIETGLTADALHLFHRDMGRVRIPRDSDAHASLRRVSIWKSTDLLAEDCGDDAAAWLSGFLASPVRLVRIGSKFHRPMTAGSQSSSDLVSFVDAGPVLVISEASLADLNDRLIADGGDPVPMDRFRPNLVVNGCSAYAEDSWERLRIGGITFRPAGPCTRCSITTIDQSTGERGQEPLRTLARYRRASQASGDVNFGQYYVHETKSGTLRVTDAVEAMPVSATG